MKSEPTTIVLLTVVVPFNATCIVEASGNLAKVYFLTAPRVNLFSGFSELACEDTLSAQSVSHILIRFTSGGSLP